MVKSLRVPTSSQWAAEYQLVFRELPGRFDEVSKLNAQDRLTLESWIRQSELILFCKPASECLRYAWTVNEVLASSLRDRKLDEVLIPVLTQMDSLPDDTASDELAQMQNHLLEPLHACGWRNADPDTLQPGLDVHSWPPAPSRCRRPNKAMPLIPPIWRIVVRNSSRHTQHPAPPRPRSSPDWQMAQSSTDKQPLKPARTGRRHFDRSFHSLRKLSWFTRNRKFSNIDFE